MAGRGAPRRTGRAVVGVRRRPAGVAGWRLTLSAVAVGAILVGVFAFADELRHPLPDDGQGQPASDELAGDPRDDVECPPPGGATAGSDAAGQPLEVSSTDLLSCPGTYDGRVVRYQGEAVGEVLHRGDHAWVQLNDDIYSEGGPLPHRSGYAGANSGIAARLPPAAARDIAHAGGPRTRGDVVAVVGRFHRAMPGSAEAVVIDVRRVAHMAAGGPIDQPVLIARRVAGTTLAVLAAAMVIGERVVNRRR